MIRQEAKSITKWPDVYLVAHFTVCIHTSPQDNLDCQEREITWVKSQEIANVHHFYLKKKNKFIGSNQGYPLKKKKNIYIGGLRVSNELSLL